MNHNLPSAVVLSASVRSSLPDLWGINRRDIYRASGLEVRGRGQGLGEAAELVLRARRWEERSPSPPHPNLT